MPELKSVSTQSPTRPLWWIVAAPLLTVPVTISATQSLMHSDACVFTAEFMGGTASCPTSTLASALAPGLINLVPLVWLLSRDTTTKKAAILASCLGLVRLAVPLAALLTSGPWATVASGVAPTYPNDLWVVGASMSLWFASVVALIVVARPRLRPSLGRLAKHWHALWE